MASEPRAIAFNEKFGGIRVVAVQSRADAEGRNDAVAPTDIQAFIEEMAEIFASEYFRTIGSVHAKDLKYMRSIISKRDQGWVADGVLLAKQKVTLKKIKKRWARQSFKPADEQIQKQMVHEYLLNKLEERPPAYKNCTSSGFRTMAGFDSAVPLALIIGTVLIILGEFGHPPNPDASAVFLSIGSSCMVAAGSYSIGRLILLGMGVYEFRKRRKWLIDNRIDLRKEVLKAANRIIGGADLSGRISALCIDIEMALKDVNGPSEGELISNTNRFF